MQFGSNIWLAFVGLPLIALYALLVTLPRAFRRVALLARLPRSMKVTACLGAFFCFWVLSWVAGLAVLSLAPDPYAVAGNAFYRAGLVYLIGGPVVLFVFLMRLD